MPSASQSVQPYVSDTVRVQQLTQRVTIKVGELARTGIPSYVSDHTNPELLQEREEVLTGTAGMPDRENP